MATKRRTPTHDDRLKAAGLPTLETLTRRILRVWDRATPSEIEAGSQWYPEARGIVCTMAASAGRDPRHAAAVVSHLSPRVPWARNVLAAHHMLTTGERLPGVMGGPASRAESALRADPDSLADTFGGSKTRSFYANLTGDDTAVTVDVWACRVVGVDPATELPRAGIYDAVAAAYRRAAHRACVLPSTMQATTWVVVRGGRAD